MDRIKPDVSVIMPCYLGNYKGAAFDRELKFIKAVESFLKNTLQKKELIIIGDNCNVTKQIIKSNFSDKPEIKFVNLDRKRALFSGELRSIGISMAKADIIAYLDSDDYISPSHLEVMRNTFNESKFDWAYYNDYLYFGKRHGKPDTQMRESAIYKGKIGTSSICHKRELNVNWDDCDGYGHDFMFVNKLRECSKKYGKIYGLTYYVCHSPGLFDTKVK